MKSKLLKKIIIRSLYLLGILQFSHYLARHKITMLYLHSIIDAEYKLWSPLRDHIYLEDLEFSLWVLKNKYTFISLPDAIAILKGEMPPVKNGLVITLDDGYLNNIKLAGPVFKKLGIKPTLFIATEFVGKNRPFWFDRLDYALQQIRDKKFPVKINNRDFIFNCKSRRKLKQSYALFRAVVKNEFKSDKEMNLYLDNLACVIEEKTGKALTDIIEIDGCSEIASWSDLKPLITEDSFSVGSHTVNHARLTLVDHKTALTEVTQSKLLIEKKLGICCDTFCYPDNSYNSQVVDFVKEHYQAAATTDKGLNKIGCDMMRLKRFNMPTHQDPYKLLFSISAFLTGASKL